MRISFLFTLYLYVILLSACDNVNSIVEESYKPFFTSFSFEKGKNTQLEHDITVDLEKGDSIVLFIPNLKTDSLVASFDGNFADVKVGGGKTRVGSERKRFQ